MTYELAIHPLAEVEWKRLDESVKRRFKQKLAKERLLNPRVAKDALHGVPDCYKIKSAAPQFRLACHVEQESRLLTMCTNYCKRGAVHFGGAVRDVHEQCLATLIPMNTGRVVHLDADNPCLVAIASVRYKLAMADAINLQTAQLHQAQFFTQDADLMDVQVCTTARKLPLELDQPGLLDSIR